MSITDRKFLVKHGTHALLYAGANQVLGGYRLSQVLRLRPQLGAMSVPLPVAFAILGVANSIMADVFHSVVKAEIPVDAKYEDDVSFALSVAYSAMMAPMFAYLLSPGLFKQIGPFKLAGLAAASEGLAIVGQGML